MPLVRLIILSVILVIFSGCYGGGGSPDNSNTPGDLLKESVYTDLNDPVHGSELWRLGSTAEETFLIKDINPGTADSGIKMSDLEESVINNIQYFAANDGIFGIELWRTDGTTAGTYMIKDINPGSGSLYTHFTSGSPYEEFFTIVLNDILYFSADDGSYGMELWKSDGTEAGTMLVKDINPGVYSSNPESFYVLNNIIYFRADNGTNGIELWRTDGTAAGTYMVKDINPGALHSIEYSDNFIELNGILYFKADGGAASSYELWRTDGTSAGTYILKDINPGPGDSNPYSFILFNGKIYFRAHDNALDDELWVSDGTPAGTYRVKDIYPGSTGSDPDSFAVCNGVLYFTADDGVHGSELWRSDGTDAGTVMVKDIYPGVNNSDPADFSLYKGVIYLTANDGVHGEELWKSDGTETGTVMVNDFDPGGGGDTGIYIILNGLLILGADDGIHGRQIWSTDGTSGGMVLIH